MLTDRIKRRYRASSRGIQIWAERFLQEIDGGLAWSTVRALRPASYSRHQWIDRLDKVVRNVLRPKQRNAIYIEYLSPAESLKAKIAIWASSQRDMSPLHEHVTYHAALESALAVIESYRSYWDPDFTEEDRERQHNAELNDEL